MVDRQRWRLALSVFHGAAPVPWLQLARSDLNEVAQSVLGSAEGDLRPARLISLERADAVGQARATESPPSRRSI